MTLDPTKSDPQLVATEFTSYNMDVSVEATNNGDIPLPEINEVDHIQEIRSSDHSNEHNSHRPFDVVFQNISVIMKQKKFKSSSMISEVFSSIKSKLNPGVKRSPSPSSSPSTSLPQDGNSKYILDGISGYAHPGQILGIMGPSGSGKTTLLSALSGRLKYDEGSITLNGEVLNKQLRRKICYVLQQDIFFPDLTLRQTLLYTALLRLPESMDYEKKIKHVDNIIDVLDLRQCQHTIIGDMAKRGLSGGEKKRASIACELLTNPSVLLIDEPTSGLDSSTALNLMQLLKNYAVKERKTVITTIHQPSSQIFHMFDKLLLLTSGQLAYFGDVTAVVPFFASIGYHMSTHYNPADFVLERIKGDPKDSQVIVDAAKSLCKNHSIDYNSHPPSHHHHTHSDDHHPHDHHPHHHSHHHQHHSHQHHHHSHQHHHHPSRKISQEQHDSNEHQSPLLGEGDRNECSIEKDPLWPPQPVEKTESRIVVEDSQEKSGGRIINDCDSGRSSWSEADRSSTKTFSSASSSCSDDLNLENSTSHAYEKWATSFLTQLTVLTKRNFYEARGRMLSKLNWIQTFGLALVTGCIWYQIPRTEETINDVKGWMFFSMTYWMLFALFNALVSFPPEREVINKERASGAYRLSSYYLAKMIGELPLTLTMPTTFHFISYPMLGCYNLQTFLTLWLFQILSSVVAQSVGLFVGAATVDLEVSITISALYSMSSILFGGFYSTTMPSWLSWLRYFSIVYYALQNMLQIEFSSGSPIRCSVEGSKYSSCQSGNQSFISFDDLKMNLDTMNLGSEPLPIWFNTIILIFALILFRGMGYLVLRYIRKPK